MNLRMQMNIGGALTCALLLSGCGGGSEHAAMAGPPTQIQGETVAGVLAMAKVESETGDALVVGNDALAASEIADETSDPLPVG